MTLPCFNYFKEIFYLNNIKIVPLNIYKLLTPIGLAFWIMDDGTYNKKGKYLVLCTDNFSHKEVLYLIYVLKSKFNLHCRPEIHAKVNTRIAITSYSMDHLRFLVKDHIHPSMSYKLGLPIKSYALISSPETT